MNKKKILDGLKYSGTIISHPIQGVYEMRFEGQGDMTACIILMVLFVFSVILKQVYTGFIFNTINPREYSVIREMANVLFPFFLWCIANWSVTALMDGEGRFKDIYMSLCYATVPFIITNILYVPMSYWFTAGESGFLGIVNGIGEVFFLLYAFIGNLTVHQFSLSKAVFTVILTLFGMVFIMFLMVLFASMFDSLYSYLSGIVTEIQLRV
ncbi:MAG: hypothetical protein J6Z00_03325 [Clostridia bacterium]|nr:hypothetical protein [Clostridia bacterium]